jgi:hypothetical protein
MTVAVLSLQALSQLVGISARHILGFRYKLELPLTAPSQCNAVTVMVPFRGQMSKMTTSARAFAS